MVFPPPPNSSQILPNSSFLSLENKASKNNFKHEIKQKKYTNWNKMNQIKMNQRKKAQETYICTQKIP